jgi:trehalose synthase-fused probable maltokinase
MIDLRGDNLCKGRQLRADVKSLLETEYLPRYLHQRRWFARKGGSPPLLTIKEVISMEPAGGPVLLFIEESTQTPQTYFVPVGIKCSLTAPSNVPYICEVQLATGRGYLVDALEEISMFVDLMSALEHAQDNGSLSQLGLELARAPGFPTKVTAHDVRRLGAEQSNSSLQMGSALFKAFRKLEGGIHPELEMARYLSGPGRFANTPRLLGSLEKLHPYPITLCLFQKMIENRGNAWDIVCQFASSRDSEDTAQLVELAALLGSRTANLHTALALGVETDFSAEPILPEDIAKWIDDICENATSSLDALVGHPSLACQRLVARREELYSAIRDLPPPRVHSLKSRLHGDFHLGQVLVTSDDVFIIDFEGEPMRTFAERRSKYPPMKDIAGLLRSFDYVAAVINGAGNRNLSSEVAATIDKAKRQFLETYRAEASGFPESINEANALLRLFMFEKTSYEIRYEIYNRPEWVEIPVAGALALLDGKINLFDGQISEHHTKIV